ncbi:MAG TPA: oxygenase MpaB family protein, partial [Acidimicrobiales bacterium]|nr:oxygenase MpaB family protein [Acidimicrobiales bacterium]
MNDERFSDDALDAWRAVADEPADELARALLTAYGVDEHGGQDETEVLGRAVRMVVAGTATRDDAVRDWLLDGPDLPGWADDDLIAAGQRFFGRWPMPIATTLFCAALPTAYAAPHGAAVLAATSRLGDRPYVSQRLAETGRMVFDALDPTTVPRAPGGSAGPGTGAGVPGAGAPRSLHPGSQGYLTVRGVRLLHALVRQTLLNRHDDPWPLERRGLPINQEDMLGALLTFTVTVLDGLDRLGIPVSPREAHAYVHTWRVIGALLSIDEALLPASVGEARAAAAAIGRRQLGPSRDGTALAGELLKEMRLAMPAGCRELPGALVHRLVPDIADVLGVPRPGPVWRGVVDHAALLAHRCQGIPGLRELVAAGPGAVVGRSVLLLFMDRQDQAGPPSYRVEAGQLLRRARGRGGWRRVARRTARRQRRGDTIGGNGPAGAPTGPVGVSAPVALPAEVALPIDADDVRLLASKGFTLWEPVDDLVRRNRCITVAYADLSRGLAEIVADGDEVLDANWCTFATWSS